MSKVDDLLLDGTVLEDTEDATKVIFNVPLRIPKDVVNSDGFELFAKQYGWTENAKDEMGDDIGVNPVSAQDFGVSVIRSFTWDVLTSALVNHASEQAKAAALAQVNALRNP
jgi:hypothetical protein